MIGSGGKVAAVTHLAGGAANAALMLASGGSLPRTRTEGVRVNAVNPGRTFTERLAEGMQAEARQQGISVEAAIAKANQSLPLGRFAKPEEIADAVVYLSPAPTYVNGALFAMDGALTPMVV